MHVLEFFYVLRDWRRNECMRLCANVEILFVDDPNRKPLEIVYVTNITEKATPPARKQQGMHHLTQLIIKLLFIKLLSLLLPAAYKANVFFYPDCFDAVFADFWLTILSYSDWRAKGIQ